MTMTLDLLSSDDRHVELLAVPEELVGLLLRDPALLDLELILGLGRALHGALDSRAEGAVELDLVRRHFIVMDEDQRGPGQPVGGLLEMLRADSRAPYHRRQGHRRHREPCRT